MFFLIPASVIWAHFCSVERLYIYIKAEVQARRPGLPLFISARNAYSAFICLTSLDFTLAAVFRCNIPFFTLLSMTDIASGNAVRASALSGVVFTFFRVVLRIERAARLRALAFRFWRNLLREEFSFGKGVTSFNFTINYLIGATD